MVAVNSLCVFCGSAIGSDGSYQAGAHELGELLAREGIELVFGGGEIGLMGTVADACLARGGRVTGVIPAGLFSREIGHRGVTKLREVGSMHERKQLMYDLADAFVALPGGLGTLEELAEVATWNQLGVHAKPIVLLDIDDFWEPLVTQLDRMVARSFLSRDNRTIIGRCRNPREALDYLRATEPAYAEKWLTPDER